MLLIAVLLSYASTIVIPVVCFKGQTLLAVFIVLMGFLCAFTAVLQFKKAKTTLNPTMPEGASNLVDTGLFAYSRNPMYLGMALSLLGVSIYWGAVSILAILPAFIVYLTVFQIKPEEKIITNIFGQEYIDYCCRVRRWL